MKKSALIIAFFLFDAALGRAISGEYWGCTPEKPCFVAAIDGDTIQFGQKRYRLCGVDAPELGTLAGNQAREWLQSQIWTRVFSDQGEDYITCLPVGYGTPCDGRSELYSYGRVVAQCFIGQDDIGELLVEHGHAQDVPKYSGGYYRTEL